MGRLNKDWDRHYIYPVPFLIQLGNGAEETACQVLSKSEWSRTGKGMVEGPRAGRPPDYREDLKDVEFAWPLGLPLVRSLGRDLWEVRSSLTQGKIARVIFCVSDGHMILLNGFIKKTQKTPPREIELAMKRMKGQEQ